MKIMISQPMSGKTEEQIRNERKNVVEKLELIGWKVKDTIFQEQPPEECKNVPMYYLAKSITSMSEVHAVLFMNGWQNARGCKIEHEICQQYNKPIMYEYEL